MSELKPCPFCGGKAEVRCEFEPYEDEYTRDERNLYVCGCIECGIGYSAYWQEELVVRLWNTRTPQNDEVRE